MLCEGGASGHLAQMQELGDMTFGEMADIFQKVFSGDVELKEKIDGVALSVTMKGGELFFSRNKSTLKNPMSVAEAIAFFADRNERIRDTFDSAIYDLENALTSLPKDEQDKIFEDGHNFINLEIVTTGATNIIDYGLEKGMLVFHGLQQFDENWKQVNTDSSKATELYNYLKSKDLLHQKSHDISGPAVLKIKNATKAKTALKKIMSKLNAATKGMDSETTLAEYVILKIKPTVKKNAGKFGKYIDDEIIRALISRSNHSMHIPLVGINDIVAMFLEKDGKLNKGEVRSFVKSCDSDEWFDNAIASALDPIVDVIIEAGQLIIDCLGGFIAANPSETAQKLQDELEEIVSRDNSGKLTAGEAKRYEAALKKLDTFNKKINATEGVVFTYKGKIYKLTSTFGPLNQLIGLFRFKTNESKQVSESIDAPKGIILDTITDANKDAEFVIYLRGSYKPPHVGHIDMIRKYSEMNWGSKTSVKVMVSSPKKAFRPLPNGQIITGRQAVDAIIFLLNACGIKHVVAVETSDASPYDMVYDDITDDNFKESKGKVVVLGISDKEDLKTIEGLDSLINSILEELNDSELEIKDWPKFVNPMHTAIKATTDDGEPVSATNFREALGKIDADTPILKCINLVKPFLPKELNNEDILNYLEILNIPMEK